jgi:hypothetical protein
MDAERPPRYTVRVLDEHLGRTQALPDERLRVTLADGRSFVIDADRLAPRGDGTYVVTVTDLERAQLRAPAPAQAAPRAVAGG